MLKSVGCYNHAVHSRLRSFGALLSLLVVLSAMGTACVCGDGFLELPDSNGFLLSATAGDASDACTEEDCFCCASVTVALSFHEQRDGTYSPFNPEFKIDTPRSAPQAFYHPPRA